MLTVIKDIRNAGASTQKAYLEFKGRHRDQESLVNLKAFRILCAELVVLRDLHFDTAVDDNDSYFLLFPTYELNSDAKKGPYFSWFEKEYVPRQAINHLKMDVLEKICEENPYTYHSVLGGLKTTWELQSLKKSDTIPSQQDYPEPAEISFECKSPHVVNSYTSEITVMPGAWNHGERMGDIECAYPKDGDVVTLRYQAYPTPSANNSRQHIGVALMRDGTCVGWLSNETRYQVPWQWWEQRQENRWQVYGISYRNPHGIKNNRESNRKGYLRHARE